MPRNGNTSNTCTLYVIKHAKHTQVFLKNTTLLHLEGVESCLKHAPPQKALKLTTYLIKEDILVTKL